MRLADRNGLLVYSIWSHACCQAENRLEIGEDGQKLRLSESFARKAAQVGEQRARESQAVRDVPETTRAVPLFAQRRRHPQAVLSTAEMTADVAGILYTDGRVPIMPTRVVLLGHIDYR